jgi:hypothetical protein
MRWLSISLEIIALRKRLTLGPTAQISSEMWYFSCFLSIFQLSMTHTYETL